MSENLPPNDEPAGLSAVVRQPRWQFSLRTLMLWVAAACGLFAILSRVGPLWSAAIVWFLILIVGHVLGAVWGFHAKRLKILPADGDGAEPAPAAPRRVTFAPTTRLREKTKLSTVMPAMTITAALLGATAGFLVLYSSQRIHENVAGLIVGTVCSAILGGFLGFLTSSFVDVSARALREAANGQQAAKPSVPS